MPKITKCKYCGIAIDWIQAYGKWQPYEHNTFNKHQCEQFKKGQRQVVLSDIDCIPSTDL